jgi:hypothetical protein
MNSADQADALSKLIEGRTRGPHLVVNHDEAVVKKRFVGTGHHEYFGRSAAKLALNMPKLFQQMHAMRNARRCRLLRIRRPAPGTDNWLSGIHLKSTGCPHPAYEIRQIVPYVIAGKTNPPQSKAEAPMLWVWSHPFPTR